MNGQLDPAAPHAPPPPPPPISHTQTADEVAIDSFHWHLARMVTAQAIEEFRDLGRHNEPTPIMFILDAAAAVAAHEVGRSVVDIRRLNEFSTLGNRRFGGDWENEWDEVEDIKADSRARRAREALQMEWRAGGTGQAERGPDGVQPEPAAIPIPSNQLLQLVQNQHQQIPEATVGSVNAAPPPRIILGIAPSAPQLPQHQHRPLPPAVRFPLPPRSAPAPAGIPASSSSNPSPSSLGHTAAVAARPPPVSPYYQPRSGPSAPRQPHAPTTPSASHDISGGGGNQQAPAGPTGIKQERLDEQELEDERRVRVKLEHGLEVEMATGEGELYVPVQVKQERMD